MILAIGDSLGVGSDPYLRQEVHQRLHTDSEVGRTALEGLQRLRHHGHAAVLVFALGTNDSNNLEYRRTLIKVRRARPKACLVLVSIHKPGAKALNRTQRMIPGAKIAPWNHLVAQKPSLLASDGIHATARGYRLRARLISTTIQRCKQTKGPLDSL